MRRTAIIIIIILGPFGVYGQSKSIDKDILELIKLGLQENKLPTVLINKIDTAHYPLTVVIEKTKKNSLLSGEYIRWDKVEIWIWTMDNIFIFDPYWITPSNIVIIGDSLSFDFLTNTVGKKNFNYYKGTIKGMKENGQWSLTDVEIKKTKYSFDFSTVNDR